MPTDSDWRSLRNFGWSIVHADRDHGMPIGSSGDVVVSETISRPTVQPNVSSRWMTTPPFLRPTTVGDLVLPETGPARRITLHRLQGTPPVVVLAYAGRLSNSRPSRRSGGHRAGRDDIDDRPLDRAWVMRRNW